MCAFGAMGMEAGLAIGVVPIIVSTCCVAVVPRATCSTSVLYEQYEISAISICMDGEFGAHVLTYCSLLAP